MPFPTDVKNRACDVISARMRQHYTPLPRPSNNLFVRLLRALWRHL